MINKDESQRKVPKLRFKGFHDDWEQRKLGGLLEQHDQVVIGEQFPIATSSRKGLFLQSEYFDGKRAGDNEKMAFHVVPDGYVTYRLMSDDSIFHFNQNLTGSPILVSKEYPVFTAKSGTNIKFIVYNLNHSDSFAKFSHIQKKGGTRVRLYFKILNTYQISIPKIEEQNQIASFFAKLDKKMALHQRKLELLKKLKQGYLQKLFPQDGQKIPQLRFPQFSGAWEQRKLDHELVLLKDGTHGTHLDVKRGPYLLSAKNIKNGEVTISSNDRKISKAEFESIHKSFKLQEGDVLLTIVGSIGQSAVLHNPDNITFQRSVAYLRPKKMSADFLRTIITSQSFQHELLTRQVVSAQPGIYLGDLAKVPIIIPTSLVEMNNLSSLLKQLDEAIALQQHRVELLNKFKHGYLQKLFI